MVNDARPADATQRLFRQPRFVASRATEAHELDDGISAAIFMIEQASEAVLEMQAAVKVHEETIYNQNTEIANLNMQKEDAFDKLLQFEDLCRREVEKSSKAEAQNRAFSERLRVAEQRNADLTAQLDRMIKAISKSFSGKADTETYVRPLRVVT